MQKEHHSALAKLQSVLLFTIC